MAIHGAAGVPPADIACTRATYVFEHDGPPWELVAAFRDWYGPTMNAFEAAAKTGRADALQAELDELFASQNASGEAGRTSIPATFLKVIVAVN